MQWPCWKNLSKSTFSDLFQLMKDLENQSYLRKKPILIRTVSFRVFWHILFPSSFPQLHGILETYDLTTLVSILAATGGGRMNGILPKVLSSETYHCLTHLGSSGSSMIIPLQGFFLLDLTQIALSMNNSIPEVFIKNDWQQLLAS